jgi:hypothetical protein
MNSKRRVIEGIILIAAILVLAFIVNWFFILRRAHSSFQNYYAFRGCVSLVKKTDTYGICKLSSGQQIKLVKYQNKWYLGGDLPLCKFNVCL